MSHEKTKAIIHAARKNRSDFRRGSKKELDAYKANYDAIFRKNKK